MQEKQALELIRKKLIKDHLSIIGAAKHFNVTPQSLHNILLGKQSKIPQYLLDYAGFKMVTYYVRPIAVKFR